MNDHDEMKALIAIYDSLSRTKRAIVDQHVQTCPTCQTRLAAYRKMDAGLDRLVDPRPNATIRSEFHARLEAERPKRRSAFPPFFKQLSAQAAQFGALVIIAVIVFSMWLALRSRQQQPAVSPFLPTATTLPTLAPTSVSTATPQIADTTPTATPAPVWTIQQQSSLSGQLNVVRAVSIGEDGRFIAAAGSSFNMVLWESPGGRNQYQQTIQEEVAYGASLNTLAFSSEEYLAVGGAADSDGVVSVRYLSNGQEAFSLPATIPPVKSVAFSNSGNVVAIGTEPGRGAPYGSVYLWFLNYSDQLYELAFEGDTVIGLAFSPDDSLVAAVSASGIRLWQVTSNSVFQTLMAGEGRVPVFSSLAFGPDGQTIAAGTREGLVYIWELSSGQVLHRLDTESISVQSLAFSADGQQLAAVSSRGEVTVWRLDGDEPELLFRGQTAERAGLATDVIFLDGTVSVVVGMADGQVQLWQAAPNGN